MPVADADANLLMLLAAVATVTAAAWAGYRIRRHAHKTSLRQLAAEMRMSYAQRDLFGLAQRIAGALPAARTADIEVRDLVFASEGPGHRYVFTVLWTEDAGAGEVRRQAVATFHEASGRHEAVPALSLAEPDLPLVVQYRRLLSQVRQQVQEAGRSG